jgi:hypothetical protein
LVLIHGELDDSVNPYGTLRFNGTLVRAAKDFHLLVAPGANIGVVHQVVLGEGQRRPPSAAEGRTASSPRHFARRPDLGGPPS